MGWMGSNISNHQPVEKSLLVYDGWLCHLLGTETCRLQGSLELRVWNALVFDIELFPTINSFNITNIIQCSSYILFQSVFLNFNSKSQEHTNSFRHLRVGGPACEPQLMTVKLQEDETCWAIFARKCITHATKCNPNVYYEYKKYKYCI